MTRIEFQVFRGHHYVPLHFLGPNGPISEPVLAYFDTGASKCGIPREANRIFRLPVIRQDIVNTASDTVRYDVVRMPIVNLMNFQFTPPNSVQFLDTDLQEMNVEVWLHSRYIMGMNLISKFDISLKRDGKIIIER